MELGELVRMGALDLGGHDITLEVGVLAFVVVMIVALFIAKARRAHVQKLRKAASTAFYDFDVARYGGTVPGRSLIEATETTGTPSLASTFSAPKRGSRHKGNSPADPPPIPPPPFAARTSNTEGSFTSAPIPPPPPGPSTVGTQQEEAEGSALPLLVPPPPPAPASAIPPPPRG
jgi:hypothetical protein